MSGAGDAGGAEEAAEAAAYVDARDLICPLPVLKARKALKGVAPGHTVAVDATDPAAEADFRAFCESVGHGLVSVEARDEGVTRFVIARGE